MSFEQLIICHCAPTLKGIKISNLVSCSNQKFPHLIKSVELLDSRFKPFGLKCRILCRCQKFSLVFVYDVQKLNDFLNAGFNRSYLESLGYKFGNLDDLLLQLSARLADYKGFPHEIGIFLGYPIEDVIGFSENHGENFKYSGYWKVYGDTRKAKELFSSYNLCCKKCTQMAMNGSTVEEVICYAESKACVQTRVA